MRICIRRNKEKQYTAKDLEISRENIRQTIRTLMVVDDDNGRIQRTRFVRIVAHNTIDLRWNFTSNGTAREGISQAHINEQNTHTHKHIGVSMYTTQCNWTHTQQHDHRQTKKKKERRGNRYVRYGTENHLRNWHGDSCSKNSIH